VRCDAEESAEWSVRVGRRKLGDKDGTVWRAALNSKVKTMGWRWATVNRKKGCSISGAMAWCDSSDCRKMGRYRVWYWSNSDSGYRCCVRWCERIVWSEMWNGKSRSSLPGSTCQAALAFDSPQLHVLPIHVALVLCLFIPHNILSHL